MRRPRCCSATSTPTVPHSRRWTRDRPAYYSSNDELLAKLHAGGTGYDIIVPSQNAVAQLIEERMLMALDFAQIPNIKNLDPAFRKPSYDSTGQYHVIKDYGITMFFFTH